MNSFTKEIITLRFFKFLIFFTLKFLNSEAYQKFLITNLIQQILSDPLLHVSYIFKIWVKLCAVFHLISTIVAGTVSYLGILFCLLACILVIIMHPMAVFLLLQQELHSVVQFLNDLISSSFSIFFFRILSSLQLDSLSITLFPS